MNIENYIESQYRELLSCSQINAEYSDLYKSQIASASWTPAR